VFNQHRSPLMLLGLALTALPGLAAATNGIKLPSAHPIPARSQVLQVAYNGSFVNTRVVKDKENPVVATNDMFKIERGKIKGTKLIEHSISLLLEELKDVKKDKDKMAILEKANEHQQLVYVIYEFRKSMEKGGFQAYFRSDNANRLDRLKQALIELRANQYLLLLNKAIKVFADDPDRIDETFGRNSVLDHMESFERFSFFEAVDADYRSLEDEEVLVDRVVGYLNQHPKQFFADAS